MVALSEVTAVLMHRSAIDTWTDSSLVNSG